MEDGAEREGMCILEKKEGRVPSCQKNIRSGGGSEKGGHPADDALREKGGVRKGEGGQRKMFRSRKRSRLSTVFERRLLPTFLGKKGGKPRCEKKPLEF